jgi:hypothetical protein
MIPRRRRRIRGLFGDNFLDSEGQLPRRRRIDLKKARLDGGSGIA